MSYWYLGSPYSKYPGGLDAAHADVCREAARLIAAGVAVFAPIAHAHPIAVLGNLDPLDHKLWLPADQPMMDAAQGLIVLKLEGWDKSIGLDHEIGRFRAADKPVLFLDPGEDARQIAGVVLLLRFVERQTRAGTAPASG